jgi:hypothetical protein
MCKYAIYIKIIYVYIFVHICIHVKYRHLHTLRDCDKIEAYQEDLEADLLNIEQNLEKELLALQEEVCVCVCVKTFVLISVFLYRF